MFATNSVAFPATMPSGITDGPDGNVWFTDQGTPSGIGRVTPAGTVSEFGMSDGLQMNAAPDAAISGPDGNVWFDDQYGTNPAVGKITPAGQITEYPIAGEPWDLTVGIDGNVWLPTGNNDKTDTGVARVTPAGKIDIFSAGLNPTAVVEDLHQHRLRTGREPLVHRSGEPVRDRPRRRATAADRHERSGDERDRVLGADQR